MIRDVRLALRWTRRNLQSSSVAVGTLAVAIAANAVVFALVKTVVLTPLPYANPDRLAIVAEADRRNPDERTISYATARDWLGRSRAIERISLYADSGIRPIVDGRVQQLRGMRVSGDFFETLGVSMYLGRSFAPGEDTPGRANVVVLTYQAWGEVFGADPAVVGRSIATRTGPFVVAGVLPRDFQPLHMTNPAELPRVFMPLGLNTEQRDCRSCRVYRAVARLAAGASAESAAAELSNLTSAIARQYPSAYAPDAFARVALLRDEMVGTFGRAMWLLQSAVLLLLVLACGNVATLLLAQAVRRQREFAVRVALGAARHQLIRQMLAESMVTAAAAAGLGVALACSAIVIIARTATTNIPRIGELAPDRTMLLFGVAAATVTSMAFGLLPALLTRPDATGSLRAAPTATGPPRTRRALEALIGAEIALAVVLVFLVGLLGKSYWRLLQVDPGFDPEHVVTVSLLPDYPTRPAHFAYFDAIVDRLRSVPEIERVGYASTLPFSHPATSPLFIRERPAPNPVEAPRVDVYLVSDGYLDTMRIPVLRGRGFGGGDTATSEPVALVSAAAARALFGGADPLATHVQIDQPDATRPWLRVIGIVGDVHQYALDQPVTPAIYIPFTQSSRAQGYASLVVRASLPMSTLAATVRRTMIEVDPLQPVFHLQPMTTYIGLSTSGRTFTLSLMVAFGATALLLALGGVYGVVSFAVAQRTREIGLRLALGGHPAHVAWQVVRQILVVTGMGIVAGLAAASMFTRAIASLLYALSPLDPSTMAEVALLLLAAVVAASSVPGARAARVDPATALRAE